MSRSTGTRLRRTVRRRSSSVYCAEALEARELFAIFSVTNTGDSGPGSFRQALLDANAAGSADQIDFLIGAQQIDLLSPLPVISAAGGALTINGFGALVRRSPAVADFRVLESLAPTLTIDMLNITGGAAVGSFGGGLKAAGNVTISRSTFALNEAVEGGAISMNGAATLRMTDSTVSGNTATDNGGGIAFFDGGSLLLERSTISNNQTLAGANDGGGIFFFGTAAPSVPAGFSPNTLTIRNSTIHGNTANDGGGGIFLEQFTGTLLVQNSTITGNTANDASAGGGGGISKPGAGGAITLASSIVSGNVNVVEPDIRSSTTQVTANFSAIGNASGHVLSGTSGNNLAYGTDLKLGPLENNGGPTLTRLPANDSPVINAGSNPGALSLDQRSFARQVGTAADIGAVEVQVFFVTSAADSGAGTLRDAITQANATPGAQTILFGGVFSSPQTISLATSLPGISDPLTITGNTTAQNLIVRRSPSAAANFRIFTATASLTLANLTVRDGTGNNGGGISSSGATTHLTLESVIVTDNRPTAGSAGGIGLLNGGFLTVRNSTISRNAAPAGGGGILFFNGGSLLMENSTVSGNNGGTGASGGLAFQGTVTPNPPAGFTPGALVVRGSTFEGNQAGGNGGAIALSSGLVLVQSSTITRNVAGGNGGGVSAPSVVLNSSIVSGNRSGTGGTDVNADNPITANFSAIGTEAGYTTAGASGNNLPFGANLNLSPLGNFGGPTQTVIPGAGSAAINAGSNPLGLTTDQRGAGFVRVSGAAADIGATEAQNVLTVLNANDAGAGSLRQAILDANTSGAFDTIVFDPAFFATARTISLLSALPTITGETTIFGPGKDLLTVRRDASAGTNFRIFDSTASTLNLFGMTITGANNTATNGGGVAVGGVAPNATLDGVAVTGNTAHDGGGIAVNNGGFLAVRNSTIAGNAAQGAAGIFFGLVGVASLVLENSTVSNNQATAGTAGGLFLAGTASANPPVGFMPSTFVVRNSTIANNSSSQGGAGIRATPTAGTVLVQNSTITENTGLANGGGGIGITGSGATLTLANTVVSGNTSPSGPDISSPNAINANFSAIGNHTGFTFSGTSSSNLLAGTNLMLSPLGYNAGPTQTRRPLPGSPLINAGSAALNAPATTTDQRGPGFARVLGSNVDIGAVETGTPFITGLFVRGTTWSTNFMNFLQSSGQGDATLGFFIAPTAVPDELPWVNLNQVSAQFSDPLAGSPGFGVFGTQTPAGPALGYDATRFALQYTFTGGNMLNDRFNVVMSNVVSEAGVRMAGLDNFTLLTLPGDVNRSGGVVNAGDVTQVRNRQFTDTATPGVPPNLYTAFHDVNGNGVINAQDVTLTRNRQFTSVPPALMAGLVQVVRVPLTLSKIRATDLDARLRKPIN